MASPVVWVFAVEQRKTIIRATSSGRLTLRLRGRSWGRIVNVSTGLVQEGFPGNVSYIADKLMSPEVIEKAHRRGEP